MNNEMIFDVQEYPTLEALLGRRIKIYDDVLAGKRFAIYIGSRERWEKITDVGEVKMAADGEGFPEVRVYYKESGAWKPKNPAVSIVNISGFRRGNCWHIWEEQTFVYKHDAEVAREVFN